MVNTPTLPKIPLTIYTSPSPHQAATTQNIHFHILDLPDPSRPSLTRASLTRPSRVPIPQSPPVMHPSYVPVYSTPTPFVYHVSLAAPGPERPTALKFSTAAWCRPLPGSAWRPAPWCPATAAALAALSAAPLLARPAVVAAADAVGRRAATLRTGECVIARCCRAAVTVGEPRRCPVPPCCCCCCRYCCCCCRFYCLC